MPIATVAETQAIIDDYNSQETHAVYETTFDTDDWCFETTEDADDIAAVFMNGGSVVIRLTDDTEGWSYLSDAGDLYLQMVGYYPPYTYTDESDDYTTNALFLFAQPNNLFDDGYSTPSFNITHTGVSEDGKLRIYIEQPEN